MKSAIIYALIPLVAGHGAIIKATAPGGGSGMALGVDPDTPRDTTRRDPGQLDSTRFKGDAADTVGETVGAGTNDIDAGTKAIMTMTGDMLPQVAAGGEIQMTVHQVNGDGAGPYSCMINTDATAAEWTDIQVTQNVPGEAGRNRVSDPPNIISRQTRMILTLDSRTVLPPTSLSTLRSQLAPLAPAPSPARRMSAWSDARTQLVPVPSVVSSQSRWLVPTRPPPTPPLPLVATWPWP